MPLKQRQITYIMSRISDIENAKNKEIDERVDALLKPQFDAEHRFREFKRGNYKIKKGVTEIKWYTNVTDILEFPLEEQAKAQYNKDLLKLRKQAKKDREDLRNRVTKLRDEVMLGDGEEAMRLLEKLEAFAAK